MLKSQPSERSGITSKKYKINKHTMSIKHEYTVRDALSESLNINRLQRPKRGKRHDVISS